MCPGPSLEFGGDMVLGYGTLRRENKEGGSCGLNWIDSGSTCTGPDWTERMGVASKGPIGYE